MDSETSCPLAALPLMNCVLSEGFLDKGVCDDPPVTSGGFYHLSVRKMI